MNLSRKIAKSQNCHGNDHDICTTFSLQPYQAMTVDESRQKTFLMLSQIRGNNFIFSVSQVRDLVTLLYFSTVTLSHLMLVTASQTKIEVCHKWHQSPYILTTFWQQYIAAVKNMSSLSQSRGAVFESFHRHILSAQTLLTATIWLIGEALLRAINAEEGAGLAHCCGIFLLSGWWNQVGQLTRGRVGGLLICHITANSVTLTVIMRAKTKTEENYFCHLKKCHNCMKFTQLVDNTQYIMALQKKIEAETEEGSLYATSQ